MRKILFTFLCLLLLSSCSVAQDTMSYDWDGAQFYRMELGEEGKDYYFRYPKGAAVSEGKVIAAACVVNFAFQSDLAFMELEREGVEFEKDRKMELGLGFETWYQDDLTLGYFGYIDEFDYVFWVYGEENEIVDCMDLVDGLTRSFTDEALYVNDKFSFSVTIPLDLKLNYLPNESGILLEKWVEDEDGGWYVVELKVAAFENVFEYFDLGDFINHEYRDYTNDFISYDSLSGVYVDTTVDFYAIRHFFAMSDDAETVYDLSLKTQSVNYADNRNLLDEIAETLELL